MFNKLQFLQTPRTGCLIALALSLALDVRATASPETLVVYAYESFQDKGGLGPWLKEQLAVKNISVELVPFGSAGEAVNRVLLEGKKTRADILVGVDGANLARAVRSDLFEKFPKDLVERVPAEMHNAVSDRFLPWDHGYLAVLYDSATYKKPLPKSFKELISQPLRKQLIAQDPRTSSLGLDFLLWTRLAAPPPDWEGFWKNLNSRILTYAPGWSAAYGLFLKDTSKFVVSYTTSPAYHMEKENKFTIQAIPFSEGHYHQIETVGMVKHSPHKTAALQFVRLLLSNTAQEKIPTTQWMYPVVQGVKLPASYSKLIKVSKPLIIPYEELENQRRAWLDSWVSWVTP